jgi:hypothetical protein
METEVKNDKATDPTPDVDPTIMDLINEVKRAIEGAVHIQVKTRQEPDVYRSPRDTEVFLHQALGCLRGAVCALEDADEWSH